MNYPLLYWINKFASAAKQTTFQADLPSQFVYFGGSMFSSKCLQRMCQVGPRQAASLPAESVFFSIEIKINSCGVRGNVLVSVMDILPPLYSQLTFLLNLLFLYCLASRQDNLPALSHAFYQHYKHTCKMHAYAHTCTYKQTRKEDKQTKSCITDVLWQVWFDFTL